MNASMAGVAAALLLAALPGCSHPQPAPEPFVAGPVVASDGALTLRVANVPAASGWAWDVEVDLGAVADMPMVTTVCGVAHASVRSVSGLEADLRPGCDRPSWVPLLGAGPWRTRVIWNGTYEGFPASPGVQRVSILADVLLAPAGDVQHHSGRLIASYAAVVNVTREAGTPMLRVRIDPTGERSGNIVATNVGTDWAYAIGGGCVQQVAWRVQDSHGKEVATKPPVQACPADIQVWSLRPGAAWTGTLAWDGLEWVDDGGGHSHREPVAPGTYAITATVHWMDQLTSWTQHAEVHTDEARWETKV